MGQHKAKKLYQPEVWEGFFVVIWPHQIHFLGTVSLSDSPCSAPVNKKKSYIEKCKKSLKKKRQTK